MKVKKQTERKKPNLKRILTLLVLVLVTVVVYTVYRVMMHGPYFGIALVAYMVLTALLTYP